MIKHKSSVILLDFVGKEFYLCNQAVTPTNEKLVYSWHEVTCKNCLRQKPTYSYCDYPDYEIVEVSYD